MFISKNQLLEASDEQNDNSQNSDKQPQQPSFQPVREKPITESINFGASNGNSNLKTSNIQSRHFNAAPTNQSQPTSNAPLSSSTYGSSSTNQPQFNPSGSSFNRPPTNSGNSNNSQKPKNNGNAMLVFSSGSEDEDSGSKQNNKPTSSGTGNSFNPTARPNTMMNPTNDENQEQFQPFGNNTSAVSENVGSSTLSSRPGTSSSTSNNLRLKQLEEQKKKLQEKMNMQNKDLTIKKNESYRPKLWQGESNYDKEDIDLEHLERIQKETKKPDYYYEPGQTTMKSTTLTLAQNDNKIVYQQEEIEDKPLVVQESEQQQENLFNNRAPPVEQKVEDLEDDKKQKKQKQTESSEQEEEDEDDQEKAKADQEEKNNKQDDEDDDDQDVDEEELRKQLEQMKKDKQNQEAKVELGQKAPSDEEKQSDSAPTATQQKLDIPKVIEYNDIQDMKAFLVNPVPKGMIVQTTIKRDKSGFARFYPKYHCYLSNGSRQIISGQKRSANNTSNYLMCMNPNDLNTNSPGYLGKVRSNFLGTEFRIYDTGENPGKAKTFNKIRKELGGILYESNLLGARGPRKIRVLIPSLKENGEPIEWKPLKEKEGLIDKFKGGQTEGLLFYRNKPPKWNDIAGAFVLNFNGRVTQPSVKNFQLVDDNNDEHIYLQFGRIEDEHFNLDFQWPLSPLQAFGIALSSFDYKIACE